MQSFSSWIYIVIYMVWSVENMTCSEFTAVVNFSLSCILSLESYSFGSDFRSQYGELVVTFKTADFQTRKVEF